MIIYLPTTIGSRSITADEAVAYVTACGHAIDVFYRILDGMYVTNSNELVSEVILEIETQTSPQVICQLFEQESVLFQELDGTFALITSRGEIMRFTHQVTAECASVEEAMFLQESWARRFGGATRHKQFVWSFIMDGDE